MKKTLYALTLIAALFALSACATMDSSSGESKYKMVDVTTAKALHERNAVFIDVRTKNWFDQGHIPDAVSIPFYNFNHSRLAKSSVKTRKWCFTAMGFIVNFRIQLAIEH